MPLITVKPKFQVTIPAKLRRGMNLQEGDVMEATVLGNGILLRPMEVVDRASVADRIAARFLAAEQSSEDGGRTEDEIMDEIVADVADSRGERRDREAS
ncbi:MAG: AbrB/MazE/SpoVT family DNA-binding domain-containing protein [Deltaproteobacteria bacterium]|nr:AbrB/MazE/SpoVT family DNA-binding domain-containing protein [Deltaproteobacteria bacterium]